MWEERSDGAGQRSISSGAGGNILHSGKAGERKKGRTLKTERAAEKKTLKLYRMIRVRERQFEIFLDGCIKKPNTTSIY